MCDARVLWGGNEAIAALRALPLAPTATELVFPDRFSLAAMSAEAVLALDDAGLDRLRERFYRDVVPFGGQACSSPRILAWIGDRSVQVRNDAVIISAGGILPTEFLRKIGLEVATKYGTA